MFTVDLIKKKRLYKKLTSDGHSDTQTLLESAITTHPGGRIYGTVARVRTQPDLEALVALGLSHGFVHEAAAKKALTRLARGHAKMYTAGGRRANHACCRLDAIARGQILRTQTEIHANEQTFLVATVLTVGASLWCEHAIVVSCTRVHSPLVVRLGPIEKFLIDKKKKEN